MRERRTAQETSDNARRHASAAPPLSAALRSAFAAIGQKLPEIWNHDLVSPSQKKALLRCLIDKVVIHRRQRDTVATRIVWQGGEVTAMALPLAVGSWSDLSHSAELAQHILEMHHHGLDDETIAQRLTAQGDRSPLHPTQFLPSTVQGMRLKHRVLGTRSQSHPRRIAGYLTIPQTAVA